MATSVALDPFVEELMNTIGKAEIVDGKIVEIMPTGGDPGFAADEIYAFLREFARRTGYGRAVGDNKGFLCDLPNRKSFSPDAAFYTGELPEMGFYPQPPTFAVEVRSENDYGRRAELAIAAKVADYLAAGTLVVWDVDLRNEEVVAKYTPANPREPEVFRRGELANAEPAVPGWTLEVNSLFAPQRP